MNILMINQPLNNRGDESAHRALVRALLRKEPQARITVAFLRYDDNQINEFRVEDSRVEYLRIETLWESEEWQQSYCSLIAGDPDSLSGKKRLVPAMETFRQLVVDADFVLNAPGGICMGGFQDWGHLDELRIVKNLKKPVAYYGRSFGPFPTATEDNVKFKALSIDMLHYFSFLSIRDKKTELLADELGVPYVSTVDSAFLETPRVEIPEDIKAIAGDMPYSVFVPNLLIWHYAYKGKLTRQEIIGFYCDIARLSFEVHPDWNILMLPQTMLFGDDNDDINLFRDIAGALNDDRIKVLPGTCSSDLQQTIVSKAQYLIGARYHSVVFAVNNNVPFIALNYEHKIEGLLETLGKKDCMIDIATDVLTQEGRKGIVEGIRQKLVSIKPDGQAQRKAKEIAEAGFEAFASHMPEWKRNPLVSVIVPMYNVEPYISECLESILSQSEDDIEIILVDDCSPDNSHSIAAGIIKDYAGPKACRIVKTDRNRGLSAVRNLGLKEARGTWVYFVDSDDIVLPGALSALLDVAHRHPLADLVQGSTVIQNPDINEWLDFVLDIHDKQYPQYTEDRDWIASNMLTVLPMTAWNKLVRKSFVIDNGLAFKEGLIHEDELWRWRMSKVVRHYAVCTHQCYWYRMDNQASIKSGKDLARSYMAYIRILGEIFLEIETRPEFDFVFNAFGGVEYKDNMWPHVKDKAAIGAAMRRLRWKVLFSTAPSDIKKLLLILSLPHWLTHRSRIRDYANKLRTRARNRFK